MNKYHILKDGQNLGPYFIDEIRARLNGGELVPDDLAWTEGMAEWQPVRTILSVAPAPPPLPSQSTQADGTGKRNESLAAIALMLPLGGAVLNMFWVGGMNLLQGPESSMNLIMAVVVIGTAILIGMEAGHLGMGGPDDPAVKAGKKATSPAGWGIGTALLWIGIFPAYMFHRSKFGVRNHLAVALLVMVMFLGTVIHMFSAIEEKKDEVRRAFHIESSDERGSPTAPAFEESVPEKKTAGSAPVVSKPEEPKAPLKSDSNGSKVTAKPPAAPQPVKNYALGENITLGGFSYQVQSISKLKLLKNGELVDSEVADAQTKLIGELFNSLNDPSEKAKGSAEIDDTIKTSSICLFVEYTIRNDGKTADVVSVTDFQIKDAKGRVFTPSSELTTKLAIEQDTDFLFKELQPGVKKKTGQVFELPSDSFDGKLTLVIPEKGMLSEGKAEVSIYTPSQRQTASSTKNATPIPSTGKRRAGLGAKLSQKSMGGLFVESFLENSVAQRAGLLAGDEIASVNGTPTPTIEDFRQIMSERTAGDKVDLVVMRQGQRKVLQIALVELADLKPTLSSTSQSLYTTTNCPLRLEKNPRTSVLQALLLGPYDLNQLQAIGRAMEENQTKNYSLPPEISKQPSMQGFNKVRLLNVDNPGSNSPLYGSYQILSGAGITVYGEKIDSFGHRDGDTFFEYWRHPESKTVLVQLDGKFTSQQLKYIISMFTQPENFRLTSIFLNRKS